jgi:hypothetical protein
VSNIAADIMRDIVRGICEKSNVVYIKDKYQVAAVADYRLFPA